jgi:hypothetical protein
MKKTALLAIALSPLLLNAQLQEELDDSFYEEEQEEADQIADGYSDDLEFDNDAESEEIADDSDSQQQDSYTQSQDSECHSPYHRMHVGVRHTEARGVGYEEGYTTVEGFGIYDHNPYFMPFLDLRGHVFNNGKLAGNVGIGERTVIPSINHIFGVYCYYDVRQENHHLNVVNQVSPGIELLGKRMEYRMNGYFPVGRDKSHKYHYAFSRFDDHNILLKYKRKFAMTGGDAEIGAHFTQSTKYDLYGAAGPYYFSSEHASSWGGKARLLGRYKEYVSLEASYSYDHLFRSIVQGTVAFNLPFGAKLRRKDRNCPQKNDLMLSRAAFAPYRFEIPVVKKKTRRTKAINPATGRPWQVWFVNNTSSSNGTFESPFPTLLQAQNASSPNDMIYVFPGDGTTTGMNMGITLQDGQLLFGSGISHRIITTHGKITIPAFSQMAPSVSNTASVITLANGNEVSGMNVLVLTTNTTGIDGSAGITGATIDSNTISSSVSTNGIKLSGSGNFSVTNNQLTSAITAGGSGINVLYTGSTNLNVKNNVCTGYANSSMKILPGASPTLLNANIVGNTCSGFGVNGISATFSAPISNIKIAGNTLNNTVGNSVLGSIAFNITAPTVGNLVIDSNTVNSTTATAAIGIFVQMESPSLQMAVSNNSVSVGATGVNAGITLQALLSSTTCANITNNQVSVSALAGNGISITTNNAKINCASISNNLVSLPTSATGNGIIITGSGTGPITIGNFVQNQLPNASITGNVSFVAPFSCSQ